MRRFFLFIALAVAATIAISCTSMLADRFEMFVDRVEKDAPSYDEEDWQKVSEQFDELMDQYEEVKDKLSNEDQKRIDKAITRYSKVILKSGAKNIIKNFDDAVKGIVKGIGSFFDSLGGESSNDVE